VVQIELLGTLIERMAKQCPDTHLFR
jgi:hypothetical protein